ncbi:MAG TPA: lactate racemase domain-containing protein [Blastocatellia bacterium]|nr:lactate racemase domain-containing protein [Blastocatellia bacterium]
MSQLSTSKLESELPAPLLVEAKFEQHALENPAQETIAQLESVFKSTPLEGKRIAIAAGSRGIDKIVTVVRSAVEYFKRRGAMPFIVPAMGSHGGATTEGQTEVLEALGINESSVGAPINADLETITLGETATGMLVHVARTVYEADALLIINRIKPHTDFVSKALGSGIRKMSVIGLGNARSSFATHRAASQRGFEFVLTEVSDFIFAKLPAVYGLALIEDAYHQLSHIEALTAAQVAEREPALLAQSARWMPSLPFAEIDVLILDEIGKNISGAGMDPNITGRDIHGFPRSDRRAAIGAIYVRGLTPESHGNAIGLGFAEVVSAKLVEQMDRRKTFTNALSAMTPASVRIPMHFDTDAECLEAALRLAGTDNATARIVRVQNTLALNRFIATENYAHEIAERSDLRIVEKLKSWVFDATGNFDSAHDLLNRSHS